MPRINRTLRRVALVLAAGASVVAAQPIEVVVTGNPLGSDAVEMVPPASLLTGERLLRLQQPTLGEVTATLPGLTSSYYGPNASRPVIRGLEGERVRILQNGIGVLDASGTSVDHAVALDPLTALRIEVLRGPATLLYGPSAVGGVVNVIDNRIPSEPVGGVTGGADLRYASPARERAVAATFDAGAPYGFQLHVDAFKRRTDDLRIPGYAWSPQRRESRGEDGPSGVLPNSASDSNGYSAGASWVGGKGFGGVAWNEFDTDYGTVADEEVTIQMKKRRFDAAGEWRDPFAGIRNVRFRYGRTDYHHTEYEGDEPGTVFRGKGYEARFEGRHAPIGVFDGVVGVQAIDFDFSAQGEEAFLPDTANRLLSVFIYEELPAGPGRVSFGARYDYTRVLATDSETFGPGETRTFRTGSASLGVSWPVAARASFVASASYSQRPPNYQELFADGPHVATGTFEVGDRDLGVERSFGFDIALRRKGEDWSGSVGAFRNRFHDYITLFPTGEVADYLPVYAYRAVTATFHGVEMEGRLALGDAGGGRWALEGIADWLRGTDDSSGQPLPRIAPWRVGGALVYERASWEARLDLKRVAKQDRVAPGELPTDGNTMLDLALTGRLPIASGSLTAFVKGVNLLDEDARTHASLIKDIAPLGRRGVVVGVRGSL